MKPTKNIASEHVLLKQLHNRDWDKLWARLLGSCAWILRKRYGVKWRNQKLITFSRQIILEVTDKIFLEKVRKWNLDEYPDFEDFIVGVVDSHINNTLNKNNKEIPTEAIEYFQNRNGELDIDGLEQITTPELRKQVFDELKAEGADDEELIVFECIADGIHKPKDIKIELGLSDEDFHNIWRRLKRKREVIKSKLAEDGY
ncbi:hypothetical protein [Zobellia nedashkovskayae]|uniref:hypothetical protein n=1 Tax=Zobellia nedashkovskayae TaxID=2779510 RepID=UPI00188AF686|nr:hypothetical protein [Zobellia nedashkovskayae]